MQDHSQILFPYAYNILGSAEDARDVVQDVLTKYYAESREGIDNEKAYLIKSVINHAINTKTRRRRTVQPDVWLPEPVATESADANIHLKDILSYSLLVLLEKLNARERAVFILKESFDYAHDEIAGFLSITEEHSRKLLSRAKTKLFKPGSSPAVSIRDQRTNALLQNYIEAIRERNLERLEGLLASDIAYFADSGGKLNLVATFRTGQAEVANLLTFAYHTYQSTSRIEVTEINHQPAFLFYLEDKLVSCEVFDISPLNDKILRVSFVLDPDKLKDLATLR
ncbi:MAG TPA: sigma-70 family RNA polymerase sigma factor [Puia sp.]|jgi:RNA polymerase sigma-70 factor (ECF subfamily)